MTQNQPHGMSLSDTMNVHHSVGVHLLKPAAASKRQMLIPRVVMRNGVQSLGFYMMMMGYLPYPQATQTNRQLQSVFTMFSIDSKHKATAANPNWNASNPVRNSNYAAYYMMRDDDVTGQSVLPFNSYIIKGNITTEFVPANMDVDLSQLNNYAAQCFQAYGTQNAKAIEQAWAAWSSLYEAMVANGQLVKSNIFYAEDSGIQPTMSIFSGWNNSNADFSHDALFNNPEVKMTWAPHLNMFTGYISVINGQDADPDHSTYTYGIAPVQANSNRNRLRKGAKLWDGSSQRRAVDVRFEFINATPTDANRSGRAEIMNNIVSNTSDIMITDASIVAHSYGSRFPNVSLASKFHLVVNGYAAMHKPATAANVMPVMNLGSGFNSEVAIDAPLHLAPSTDASEYVDPEVASEETTVLGNDAFAGALNLNVFKTPALSTDAAISQTDGKEEPIPY